MDLDVEPLYYFWQFTPSIITPGYVPPPPPPPPPLPAGVHMDLGGDVVIR